MAGFDSNCSKPLTVRRVAPRFRCTRSCLVVPGGPRLAGGPRPVAQNLPIARNRSPLRPLPTEASLAQRHENSRFEGQNKSSHHRPPVQSCFGRRVSPYSPPQSRSELPPTMRRAHPQNRSTAREPKSHLCRQIEFAGQRAVAPVAIIPRRHQNVRDARYQEQTQPGIVVSQTLKDRDE